MKVWADKFGQEYTDRNLKTPEERDAIWNRNIGVTRTQINQEFLSSLNRSMRILEVGANYGTQLVFLQRMGFKHLYGIELQSYAVEKSKSMTNNINLIQGNIFDIPFKDRYFDLVFTSGVLIHIHPEDINGAMDEIHRCTRRFIWGYEYFSKSYQDILYRENKELLWKCNFSELYLKRFSDLKLVKEKRYPYLDGDGIDTMFLLKVTS